MTVPTYDAYGCHMQVVDTMNDWRNRRAEREAQAAAKRAEARKKVTAEVQKVAEPTPKPEVYASVSQLFGRKAVSMREALGIAA